MAEVVETQDGAACPRPVVSERAACSARCDMGFCVKVAACRLRVEMFGARRVRQVDRGSCCVEALGGLLACTAHVHCPWWEQQP